MKSMLPLLCCISALFLSSSNVLLGQWTQTNGPDGSYVTYDVLSKDNYVFVATLRGGIFRSSDNGNNWIQVFNGEPGDIFNDQIMTINDLFVKGNSLFAVSGGGLYRSDDNGDTWENLSGPIGSIGHLSFKIGAAINDTTIITCSYNAIFRSTDNGATFTVQHNTDVLCMAVIGTSIFIGTSYEGILRSTDNGDTWIPVNEGVWWPGQYELSSFTVVDNDLYAGTMGGGVYRTTNNGDNWIDVNGIGLSDFEIRSLASIGTELYAGTNTGVFHTIDNGENWTALNSGIGNESVRMLRANGSTLFAASKGTLYKSTDYGANWVYAANGLRVTNIYCMAANDSYLFSGAYNTGLFRSPDEGASWMAINNGLTSRLVSSLCVSGGYLFVGTEGEGVFRSADNGDNWIPVNTGLTKMKVFRVTEIGSELYACTNESGIFRSIDNGEHWVHLVNAGLLNSDVRCLVAKGPYLFAGTWGSTSGIYRSSNNGASWIKLSDVYGSIYSLTVDGDHIYAGASANSYHSTDDGASWTQPDLQYVNGESVRDFLIRDNHVIAATDWGVFHSADYGANWEKFSTGLVNINTWVLKIYGEDLYIGTLGTGIWKRSLSEVTAVDDPANTAAQTLFGQISPNPAHHTTTISFSLKESARVSLKIFDESGKELAMIVNEKLPAGAYAPSWDVHGFAAGVYFCKLEVGASQETKQIVVQK